MFSLASLSQKVFCTHVSKRRRGGAGEGGRREEGGWKAGERREKREWGSGGGGERVTEVEGVVSKIGKKNCTLKMKLESIVPIGGVSPTARP